MHIHTCTYMYVLGILYLVCISSIKCTGFYFLSRGVYPAFTRDQHLFTVNCEYSNEHNEHTLAVLSVTYLTLSQFCVFNVVFTISNPTSFFKYIFGTPFVNPSWISIKLSCSCLYYRLFGHLHAVYAFLFVTVAGIIIATWILCHVSGIY